MTFWVIITSNSTAASFLSFFFRKKKKDMPNHFSRSQTTHSFKLQKARWVKTMRLFFRSRRLCLLHLDHRRWSNHLLFCSFQEVLTGIWCFCRWGAICIQKTYMCVYQNLYLLQIRDLSPRRSIQYKVSWVWGEHRIPKYTTKKKWGANKKRGKRRKYDYHDCLWKYEVHFWRDFKMLRFHSARMIHGHRNIKRTT